LDALGQGSREHADIAFLRAIAGRLGGAAPFAEVLREIIELATSVVKCDSCFVYVLEGDYLILRASRHSHPEALDRLKMRLGQGITGWAAQHVEPVAIGQRAYEDPRFRRFNELPEDRFEAFLSVPLVADGRLVGVINLQNRGEHHYSEREISLMATVGFLVGSEIEKARLENENSALLDRLEARTLVERAKGILQRDLNLSEAEAYRLIQKESQQRRRSMRQIAEAVVLNDGLRTSRLKCAATSKQ
jgi:uroporphyrinogen-III synthase